MTKSGDFEDEEPTAKNTPHARAAVLLAHWKQCTPEFQHAIERLAAHYAALSAQKSRPK